MSNYTKISKFLSFVLRHHPEKFGIQLEIDGFTDLELILGILNEKYQRLGNTKITKETIEEIILKSDKKRFEIKGNQIRAFYGHSIDSKIKMMEPKSLPLKLYHGTNLKAYNKIKIEGLTKKSRQYVHLADNIDTAVLVGKRKVNNPIILIIDVKSAQKEGTIFYKSGDMFLADHILPKFISTLKE